MSDINLETIVDFVLKAGKVTNEDQFQVTMDQVLGAMVEKMKAPTALMDVPVKANISDDDIKNLESELTKKLASVNKRLRTAVQKNTPASLEKAQGLSSVKEFLEGVQSSLRRVSTFKVDDKVREDFGRILTDPMQVQKILKESGGKARIENVRAYTKHMESVQSDINAVFQKASKGFKLPTGSGANFNLLNTARMTLPDFGNTSDQLKKVLGSVGKQVSPGQLSKADQDALKEAQQDSDRTFRTRQAVRRNNELQAAAAQREAQKDSNETFRTRQIAKRNAEKAEKDALKEAQQDSDRTFRTRQTARLNAERQAAAELREAQKVSNDTLRTREIARKNTEQAEKEAAEKAASQAQYALGQEAISRVGGIEPRHLKELAPGEQAVAAGYLKSRQGEIQDQMKDIASQMAGVDKASAAYGRLRDEHSKLGAELRNVKTGLSLVNQELKGNVGIMHQAELAGKQFLRYAILYGTGFKILQGIGSLFGNTFDLDKSLHQIKAITQASDEGMKAIESAIKGVATTTQFSTKEVSDAAQVLAQAGVELDKLPGILSVTAKLASTTGADLKATADVITSLTEVFRPGDNSLAGVTALADQVAQAVNISKLSTEGLKTIISLGASTAKGSNVNSEQFFGAAATLSNKGIKDSTIATGLRETMLELFSPDDKMLSYLKQRYTAIGEDVTEAFIKAQFQAFQSSDNPMQSALTELKRLGVSGAGRADFNRVTDIRAQNILIPLIDSLEQLSANTAKISQSGGVAKGAAANMESFNNEMSRLGSALVALTHDIVDDLLPALTTGAKYIGEWLNYIRAIDFGGNNKLETLRNKRAEAAKQQEELNAEYAPFDKNAAGGQAAAVAQIGQDYQEAKTAAGGVLGGKITPEVIDALLELGSRGLEAGSDNQKAALDKLKKLADFQENPTTVKTLTDIGAKLAASRSAFVGKVQQQGEEIDLINNSSSLEGSQISQKVVFDRLNPTQKRSITAANPNMSAVEFESSLPLFAKYLEDVNHARTKSPNAEAYDGPLAAQSILEALQQPKGAEKLLSGATTAANKGDTEYLGRLSSVIAGMQEKPTSVIEPGFAGPITQIIPTDDKRLTYLADELRSLEAIAQAAKAKAEQDKSDVAAQKKSNDEQNKYRAEINSIYGSRKEKAADQLAALENSTLAEVKELEAQRDLARTPKDAIGPTQRLGEIESKKAQLKLEMSVHDFENQYLLTHPINNDTEDPYGVKDGTKHGVRHLSNTFEYGDRAQLYAKDFSELVSKGSPELQKAYEALVTNLSDASTKIPAQTSDQVQDLNKAQVSKDSARQAEVLNFEIEDLKKQLDNAKKERRFDQTYTDLLDQLIAKRREQVDNWKVQQNNNETPPDIIAGGEKSQLSSANAERRGYEDDANKRNYTNLRRVLNSEVKRLDKAANYAAGAGNMEEVADIQKKRSEVLLKLEEVETKILETEQGRLSQEEKDARVQEVISNDLQKRADEVIKTFDTQQKNADKRFNANARSSVYDSEEAGLREGLGIGQTRAQMGQVAKFNLYEELTKQEQYRGAMSGLEAKRSEAMLDPRQKDEVVKYTAEIDNLTDKIKQSEKAVGEYKSQIITFDGALMDQLRLVSNNGILAKFEQLNPGFSHLRDQIETNLAGTLDGLTGLIGDFVSHGFTAVHDIQALRDAMMNTYKAQTDYQSTVANRIGLLHEIQASPSIMKEDPAIRALIIDQSTAAQKMAEAAAAQQVAIAKMQEQQTIRENSLGGQIQQFLAGSVKEIGSTIVKDALGAGISQLFSGSLFDGLFKKKDTYTMDGSLKVYVTNENSLGGGGGNGRTSVNAVNGGGSGGSLLGSIGDMASSAYSAISGYFSGGSTAVDAFGATSTGRIASAAEGGTGALGSAGTGAEGAAGAANGASGLSSALGMAGGILSIAASAYSIYSTIDTYNKSKKLYDQVLATMPKNQNYTDLSSDPSALSKTPSKTDTNYKDLAGYLSSDKYSGMVKDAATAATTGALMAVNQSPASFSSGQNTPATTPVTSGYQHIANATGQSGQTTQQLPGLRIINVTDPSLVQDYIASSAGEKVFMNFIQRNAAGIQQILK